MRTYYIAEENSLYQMAGMSWKWHLIKEEYYSIKVKMSFIFTVPCLSMMIRVIQSVSYCLLKCCVFLSEVCVKVL